MNIRHFLLAVICIIFLSGLCPVYAEEETYQVIDQGEILLHSADYEEAYRFYHEHLDEYDNLLLMKNKQVLQMEYGIVEFKSDQGCELITEYHSVVRDADDSFNACYGTDAAYLYSSRDSSQVYFRLSGDTGSIKIDEVILHPLEELKVKPSYYRFADGKLSHRIKTQLTEEYVSYDVKLSSGPSLAEGDYYSYDGHYFYSDLKQMIDDYRSGTYEHASNSEAYYDYYQYLPYRSLSSYSDQEVTAYFTDVLGIEKRLDHYLDQSRDGANDEVNRSQLYGVLPDFFVCQYLYGTNAMMLLTSAINESAYGRSLKAYQENDLYLGSAYETEAEAKAERYGCVSDSIYAFSKYFVSARFADHRRPEYSGTFFGNKLSGINVTYSLDPYYGEKAASMYGKLDEALGGNDKDFYALGIIAGSDRIDLYADEEMKTLKYRLKKKEEISFILLEETESSYKIRLDDSYSPDYLYDFDVSVAYIAKEAFSDVLNPEKIREEELVARHYDFDGGTYHGYEELDVKTTEDVTLRIVPRKTGHEFIGYDEQRASYKQISELSLSGSFKETPLNQPIDLQGLSLNVRYEDDSSAILPLTTDMISGYDPSLEGTQDIIVSYEGLSIISTITFSTKQEQLYTNMSKALAEGNLTYFKNHLVSCTYPLSFAEIRNIDHKLREKRQRNYVISSYGIDLDLSMSGLDLSLPDLDTFIYVNDTYYVDVEKIKQIDEEKILALASGYGFHEVSGLDLSFRFNYQDIGLLGPAIVQLSIPEKRNDHIYTVYHLEKDGDIVKCRTRQTEDHVEFIIYEEGAYEILEMQGYNEYALAYEPEELSVENMGYDNHRINIGLLATISMSLAGIAGIIVYYIYDNMRKRIWRDFRRSLLTAESVPEEKPKN